MLLCAGKGVARSSHAHWSYHIIDFTSPFGFGYVLQSAYELSSRRLRLWKRLSVGKCGCPCAVWSTMELVSNQFLSVDADTMQNHLQRLSLAGDTVNGLLLS